MYRRALVSLVLVLVACGSPSTHMPGAGADAPTPSYTVSGTVTGLVSDGLILTNNGEQLPVPTDGAFVFAMPVADRSPYAVAVAAQPRGEVCDVMNGGGLITHADVTDIAVVCHGVAVSLASDGTTACTVHSDGTLWCWGGRSYGHDVLAPEQIGTDTDWASVASPSCGLKTDHTWWCWGESSPPTPMDASTDWTEIALSFQSLCGIRAAGTLWCSSGTGLTQQEPAATWAHVATSDSETCAIRTDGTLWCEGDNTYGELGVGDTAAHAGFVQVGTERWKFVAISDYRFVCGVRADDSLWCWGDNALGTIDDSGNHDVPSPAQRASGTWSRVTVFGWMGCALATDGSEWCWGNGGGRGAFGVGDDLAHPDPVEVVGGHLWSDIAPACSLARDGTVWCWGPQSYGIFGDGEPIGFEKSPHAVDGAWLQVSEGVEHGCGIRSDGSMACWGGNTSGQLGTGDPSDRAAPWPVSAAGTWLAVSAGGWHTCGTQSDHSLWCWGDNSHGQLGVAVGQPARAPVRVGTDNAWTSVAAGEGHTCAIHNGELACWGDNTYGQIGFSELRATGPTTTITGGPWKAVAAGTAHTCAIASDGTLWCWGRSTTGALGSQPSCTSCSDPIQVGAATWSAVAAGGDATLAIRSDGTLWRWGNGPGVATSLVPVQVGTASSWSTLTIGVSHACAIATDKTAWCTGANDSGQLGLGFTSVNEQLTQTSSGNWTSIDAGDKSTCAIKADQSLWCWGSDLDGELGIGEAWHDVPVIVP